jgi:branched-chain amino acid transport system ATP-binding protein
MSALTLDNISVLFGGIQALARLISSVEVGERRAIIGPNGAGKTTLFNVISGMVKPTSGRVLLFDQDVTDYPVHLRAACGLSRTFQITNLFTNLSVLENIVLGLQALTRTKYVFYRRIVSFRELIDNAESLLDKWGLWDKRNYPVRNLSHGEQRQLEIVLALSEKPRILLLDEPTQGLSTAETSLVLPMIEQLDPSTTVLFIEHDIDVAFKIADTISVLYFGQILAEGKEAEIRGNPKIAEIYLGLDTQYA